MKDKLLKEGYIVNESNGLDWEMHKDTKDVLKTVKTNDANTMFKYIPEDKEYMVIRNYKSDNEYEYSIIVKDEDEYYFVTDASDLHQ